MTITLSKESFCAKCHTESTWIIERKTLEWKHRKLNISKAADHTADLFSKCTRQPAQCKSHYKCDKACSNRPM